jgi:hypothetical protein
LPARSLTASCKDFRREWRAKPVRIRRVQPLGPASRPRAMCGRVRLSSDVSEIRLVFSIPPDRPTPNIGPSWNVAPTDPLAVVRYDARAGERSLDVMRWGLVPFWAKDHESRFHEYQRQSRGDRGQARLPRSVPAAALPGAGLVCHRWSRPTGHETGGTVLPRVVGTEVGRVQAREAASRHDGLN